MKFWVGITDDGWFEFLRSRRPDEVNFWRPSGGRMFRAVDPGSLFLFKLHSPKNFIVGGGFLIRHSLLPLSLAWDAFGEKNGASSIENLVVAVGRYRKDGDPNPQIGCTILAEPFSMSEEDWIPVPSDWSPNLVQGRTYDTEEALGGALWAAVMEKLPKYDAAIRAHRYGGDGVQPPVASDTLIVIRNNASTGLLNGDLISVLWADKNSEQVRGRVGAAPTRPEGTTTFVLTHPPRFSYRFPHESAPSGRAQRASAHASGKAISYQFRPTPTFARAESYISLIPEEER